MKKVNLNGKLSLKKETIAKLNDEQMNLVQGGGSYTTCMCVTYPGHASCYTNC